MSQSRLDGELGHLHPVDADRVAQARERLLSVDDASRLASLLGLMADPVRACILYALDTVSELCVGDLGAGPRSLSRCCWLRPSHAAHGRVGDQPPSRPSHLLPIGRRLPGAASRTLSPPPGRAIPTHDGDERLTNEED